MDKLLNRDLRRRIIEKGFEHRHGHYGSSMSCVDTVKFLYDKVLTDDDVFIMSKGHGAPALHSVLESKGVVPRWTIHLEVDEEHGVMATGGSLGQGLSIALGRAYAKKLKADELSEEAYKHNEMFFELIKPGNVYCMIGDGELQEGMIWESLNIAKGLNVDNLVLLVDWNKYQAISSVKEIMGEDETTIRKKLEAFGYEVQTTNGHTEDGLETLRHVGERKGLQAVILDTQKGRGIPVLEKNPSFHVYYFHEHPEEMQEALEYLK